VKLVNEKGRLFGLINVIDLAVVLMILAIGAGLVYKVVLPRMNDTSDRLRDVHVTVVCRQRPIEVAEELEAAIALSEEQGNKTRVQLVARNGFSNGEVVDVSYVPAAYVVSSDNGEVVWGLHPYLYDITVTIKGEADPNAPVFTLGTQEMRIGYTIYVKTQRTEMTGMIEGIEFAE